jgi:hypothetical protein
MSSGITQAVTQPKPGSQTAPGSGQHHEHDDAAPRDHEGVYDSAITDATRDADRARERQRERNVGPPNDASGKKADGSVPKLAEEVCGVHSGGDDAVAAAETDKA